MHLEKEALICVPLESADGSNNARTSSMSRTWFVTKISTSTALLSLSAMVLWEWHDLRGWGPCSHIKYNKTVTRLSSSLGFLIRVRLLTGWHYA